MPAAIFIRDGKKNGSLLTNTVTPDGYRVDGSGAWVH
ncbi:MAG: hypothetical protein ACLU48_09850 [Clostridiaceae bacterium]